MSLFETITLTWGGEEYEVEPENVMKLIAVVEEHVSFQKLYSGEPPLSGIACAYAAALRYAGASVKDEEVYASLFGDEGIGIQNAITSLSMMLIPPTEIMEKMEKKPRKARKKK